MRIKHGSRTWGRSATCPGAGKRHGLLMVVSSKLHEGFWAASTWNPPLAMEECERAGHINDIHMLQTLDACDRRTLP